MDISKNNEIGVWFKSLSMLFLLGNLIAAVAYSAGLYLAMNEGEHLPIFEYIRVPLYFIDIVAFYFLFRGKLNFLKVIFATSIIYTLGAWHYGAIINNIFEAFGTYNFYMFLLTATLLPFIDVTLLYLFGKKHITIQASGTPQSGADLIP